MAGAFAVFGEENNILETRFPIGSSVFTQGKVNITLIEQYCEKYGVYQ